MAEQANEKKSGLDAKMVTKIIIGLVLIALGLLAVFFWRLDLLKLIKGSIGLFLILAGAITIAIAKE